jgi:hypothetical protein
VGGSRAVDDAYVLLPEHVHCRLRDKPVRAIEPAWFATPWVQDVCLQAARFAGIDSGICDAARLVVLLPHPDFLDAHPELGPLLSTLIRESVDRGRIVMVKGHPKAGSRTPAALLQLRGDGIVEAPPSLPVETMIPLLHDAMVVGTLSTALLTLKMLGRGLEVRSIAPVSTPFSAGAQAIFDSTGIQPYDPRVRSADPTTSQP